MMVTSRPPSRLKALALAFGLLAAPLLAPQAAYAVNPDEVLPNAEQEARARRLSAELRCLQCQNQSIDDSDAPFSREIRVLLREKITVGKTDDEILDFLVARYGQYVLLKPQFNAVTAVLWIGPFALVVGGGLFLALRSRRRKEALLSLSDDEAARLDKLLDELEKGEKKSSAAPLKT